MARLFRWKWCLLLVVLLLGLLPLVKGDDEHHPEAVNEMVEVNKGTRKPNILFIIIDDAGVQDVGYSASPESAIKTVTPTLDSLAEESIRLKEYYSHPTCTPSRSALLSGKYAHKIGLPFPLICHPIAGMDPSVPVLPQLLQQAGYKTHMVGKWHIGHSKKSMLPLNRGFDTFFGLHGGGFDHYTKNAAGEVDLWRQDQHVTVVDRKDHATNLFSREAVAVIHNHHTHHPDTPFFLYLSYSAPHDPLQADPQYLDQCHHVPNQVRRHFCGMMAQLDHGIANVTGALQELGLLDDTLIVFTSDNGGNPVVGGFNYNYRGTKSMAWEGGVRVPGFIRPPKSLHWPSRDYKGLMHIADWMPTLLSVVGAKAPEGIDGVDQSPALASPDNNSPRTTAVLQHDVFLNSTAYRSGCLKLILGNPGGNTIFLEPNNDLLNLKDEGHQDFKMTSLLMRAVEYALWVIEVVIPAPIDQFFKYTVSVNSARLLDHIYHTSYNHVLSPFQRLDLWKADLRELPPVLDWSTEHGPRVFVYDVCKDPSETFNLMQSPKGKKMAQHLYGELLQELEGSPLQYAGDIIIQAKGDRPIAYVGPFLDDDVDIANYPFVSRRVFSWLNDAFVFIGITLAVLSTITLLLFIRCFCCRGKSSTKTKHD